MHISIDGPQTDLEGFDGSLDPSRDRQIWLVLGGTEDLDAVQALVQELTTAGYSCLVTCHGKLASEEFKSFVTHDFPKESQKGVRQFIETYHVDAVVWLQAPMHTRILSAMSSEDVPLILIEANPHKKSSRWRPSFLNRAAQKLGFFTKIFALSPEAKETLIGYGLHADTIEVAGELSAQSNGEGPIVNDAYLHEINSVVDGRPIWFAERLEEAEIEFVVHAHKEACRVNHRLLLAISLNHGLDPRLCTDLLKRNGLDYAYFTNENDRELRLAPVLLVEDNANSTWYRAASICFAGGSLSDGSVVDPLPVATLGSVVVHGKNYGKYRSEFNKLMAMGGSCLVLTPQDMGSKVTEMLEVDKAAIVALNAWQAVTTSYELTGALLAHLDEVCMVKDDGK